MIVAARTRPRLVPVPRPLVPNLTVGVVPRATDWWTLHGGASAQGSQVTYTDLYAFLWYLGRGGWETRPGPGGRIGRYLRGIEDVDDRRA